MTRSYLKFLVPAVIAAVLPLAAPAHAQGPMKLQTSAHLDGDGGWDYLTADGRSHRLYISRGTHVMVVDTETGKSAGEVADTPGVHGIAIAGRLGKGFTSNGRDNSVTVFDTTTLKSVGKVSVGQSPDAIIFDRASGRVFTFNGGSNDSTAVDAATQTVAGTIALGGRPEFAVSDGKGMVYVNIEDKNEIVAIDSKALTIKSRWSIAPGDGPSGLAMDTKNRRLFAVCGNGMMVVVDADSGKVVATPAIGKGPDAAAFDSKTMRAFSSNGEGSITVIKETDPDHYTVEQTITTQPGARTMALDGRTHKIYLVTAKSMSAPAGATGEQRYRRSYAPGTFTLLTVSE